MPKALVSPVAQVFIPSTVPELEDTLPLYDSHQDRSGIISSKQCPIYSMVEFDDHELKQLGSDINEAEDSTGQSVLITKPNSSGRTLLGVYEHHIQLRCQNKQIHPSLFIVVDKADYLTKGVLVVDLQVPTDSVRNVIGVLRCGYDEADLYCANLDIGNMSFIDYKEEEQRLWNGDDPYANKRYFPNDAGLPALPSHKPQYAWYTNTERCMSVVWHRVRDTKANGVVGGIESRLEPDYLNEDPNRLHGVYGYYNSPDPWLEIRRRFPFRCLQKPLLHRHLFLVLEKSASEPGAIAICRAEWDGDLRDYHYDESSMEGQHRDREKVFAIMPEIVVVKRVDAEEALEELDRMAGELA